MNLLNSPSARLSLLLALVAVSAMSVTVMTVGLADETLAQTNPNTFLLVAERARDHIKTHIASDSPGIVHDLFAQGALHVDLLEDAVAAGDEDSAEKNFLATMKIFKEISERLHEDAMHRADVVKHNDTTAPPPKSHNTTVPADPLHDPDSNMTASGVPDPKSDLARLGVYVNTLRTVSESTNAPVDFEPIDALFVHTQQLIDDGKPDEARTAIHEIREGIIQIDSILRDHGSEQILRHAKEYAAIHLERVDSILEQADRLNIPDDVVADLVDARKNLEAADTPQEILNEIKYVMSILER